MKKIKSFFLSKRFFIFLFFDVLIFVGGFFFPILQFFAKIILLPVMVLLLIDIIMLYRIPKGIFAERKTPEKLSNGDENKLEIQIWNYYPFPVKADIIDELPFQFQKRDFSLNVKLKPGTRESLFYTVRPVERGEYSFGALNIYLSGPVGLIVRKFQFSQEAVVPVYPSIIQMRKFDIFAVSNRLTEVGIKKIRRVGSSMEFDKIRKYISGDDFRKINWKATARKSKLMVNQYREEKSQYVYSAIDMGRVMKMPFQGMTLLDYAVNASLVISNIAIRREDRAGVIAFSDKIESILPADRRYSHIFKILQVLYNIKTNYLESDYEKLYSVISRKLTQRSLILLYTNFETLSSLKRNLKYLSMISGRHFLVIIFFENTEIRELLNLPVESTEKIYIKTIAEKFIFEKKLIVKELERYGIQSIITSPENLTVNVINKYLELKARGLI